ncbi:hypothetical protein PPERSA_02191 [Pseudocohnilembus persalinus]|uniref:Golgi apparatus membrane protein TVP23 homolog n=1 Tax=Pseudocohnilembus persalinus TaxID=266149 RepID=A0A0V0R0T3_PSEPJ|nr:hypothetical protein PPERSA_02191 [Pseudocohnilembus persalinus]|eukprot:KRX08059.1 hypothetical protein PPERSA_02191 [Pseudocohnilembus persalinus]
MDIDSLDYNIKLNDEQTVPDIEDQAKKQNNQNLYSQNEEQYTRSSSVAEPTSNFDLKSAGNPIMCIVTFAFKFLALLAYLFLNAIVGDKIYTFIIVLVISCIDFWAVKNLTARFLVGLKWWNEFDENGNEIWLYSSMPANWKPHKVDKTIFWISQITITLIFLFFLIIKILSLSVFWNQM